LFTEEIIFYMEKMLISLTEAAGMQGGQLSGSRPIP
jgi:hypothetical protein